MRNLDDYQRKHRREAEENEPPLMLLDALQLAQVPTGFHSAH